MPAPRVYHEVPSPDTRHIRLEGQAASHLSKVLRLKIDDAVEIFDGNNGQYAAHITHIGKKKVELEINHYEQLSRESSLKVTLIQGIARGERMDWMLQKATELGVHRIIPTLMTRSVVRLDNKRIASRLQHWQGVITHACEQCGRNQLPIVEKPMMGLATAIDSDQSDRRYYLNPTGEVKFHDIETITDTVCLIIGPEGGYDENEKTLMDQAGIPGLTLGPRILRTETAGIAALSAIGAIWGDL